MKKAKSQTVFLYKCLSNNVTPKSFRLRASIKTTKCENITKQLRRKLLTHRQIETKRRIHESKNRIRNIWIICKTKKYTLEQPKKLLSSSYHIVYELSCDCGGDYIGEIKKRVLTRWIEHQENSMVGKWEASGPTEHSKGCHRRFDWLHPKMLAKLSKIHENR